MTKILESVHGFVWGAPALVLILGVGLYLTVGTGFAQITLFPKAMAGFFRSLFPGRKSEDGVSSFQALCTALAATVGTGNLVGVAGAICLGGPGSVFWMWICALLGMVTKYAEVVLAVRFRKKQEEGFLGGPMYIIEKGLGIRWRWLAVCYCLFGIVASFGVGNAAQINAVVSGIHDVLNSFGIESGKAGNYLLGIALALLVWLLLSGGAARIGKAAEKLVPAVSAMYILLCAGVLLVRWRFLDDALHQILQGAFHPKAVTGGMLGSSFQVLKVGCSRGVFTNEAGMGTASIAHACAKTEHPVKQGMMGIVEVFLDTIVICTLTALVILVSGVPIGYGSDPGGELTTAAFASIYGRCAVIFLAVSLCCFAIATILGWGLYGGRCAEFLFGRDAWGFYVAAQAAMVVIGSVLDTESVWLTAETVNGLMAIPNLIALAVLAPEVARLTKEYKEITGKQSAGGGYQYANFHQRKPLRTLSHAEIPSHGGGCKKAGKKDLSSEHRSAGPADSRCLL